MRSLRTNHVLSTNYLKLTYFLLIYSDKAICQVAIRKRLFEDNSLFFFCKIEKKLLNLCRIVVDDIPTTCGMFHDGCPTLLAFSAQISCYVSIDILLAEWLEERVCYIIYIECNTAKWHTLLACLF